MMHVSTGTPLSAMHIVQSEHAMPLDILMAFCALFESSDILEHLFPKPLQSQMVLKRIC